MDQNGLNHTLSSYFGQKIVVYFYPKDDTPGCTKEACGIRDHFDEFISEQIRVFGISYDNPASHKNLLKNTKFLLHCLVIRIRKLLNCMPPKEYCSRNARPT